MHLVASTFNPPSAVLYSLACSFRHSDERYLVICKSDKLEEIWGSPKGLTQLESSKHLVLALDIPQARIIVLEFKAQSNNLHVHHTSSVSPLTHRPSVSYSGILVNNQTVCAAFYNGHVKLLEVEAKEPYKVTESDLRVHELTIQSMCFTVPSSNGVLAIVYTDQYGSGRLIGRTAQTLSPDPLIPEKDLEDAPSLIIPVKIEVPSQEPTFGVLLIGEKLVTFVNTGLEHDAGRPHQSNKGKGKSRTKSKSDVKAEIQASMVTVQVPFLDVTAWIQVDGTHLVVGDSFGRLYLLTMSMEPEFTLKDILLGEVSVPSTLSYLSNNILYVGSYSAPSQLVRISEDIREPTADIASGTKRADDQSGHIEILLSHDENVAPILDAILVNTDGSEQARIAAVSGDDSGGSLHITHRGASFHESAVLDGLPNLESLFTFKKFYSALEHGYLAATTTEATFIFSISSTGLTYLTAGDFLGISRTSSTLILTNLDFPGVDAIVHVTANHISIVDLVTGQGMGSWDPPLGGNITAAAADVATNSLCVATSEGMLFCLGLQAGSITKKSQQSFKHHAHSQISALAINQNMLIATFWGSNEILRISASDLQPLGPAGTEPSAATSVILTDFGDVQMYSIIARLDGALVVQDISPDGSSPPNTKREIPLGGGPISLALVPGQGGAGARVIAAGKQAVVLSISKKRLQVSSLSLAGICAASALEAPSLGISIVCASSKGLVFGQIKQLDKLNITSHKLGDDSPLRINYHPQLSTFVVGCMRVMVTDDNERYFIRFLDHLSFNDLGRYKLQYQEVVSSIESYNQGDISCILVGTGITNADENEARSGQLMLFKADADSRTFKLEYTREVEGIVSSIKQFKHRILVAINERVHVYEISKNKGTLVIGESLAKWERAYHVESVVVRGETIVVADKLRSVSVLRLVERLVEGPGDGIEDGGDLVESLQLETIAMDMGSVWPCAVEILGDGKTVIAAQLDGNILTWEIGDRGLEPGAAFYVGEVINKFVVLSRNSTSNTRPVALYVTNSGRIGMLSTVDTEDAFKLTRLEHQMDKAIKGLGGMRNSEWRKPKLLSSSKEPPPRRGITDGDYIKKFLELDEESARNILLGGSAAEQIGSAEEMQIRRCLEALSVDQ